MDLDPHEKLGKLRPSDYNKVVQSLDVDERWKVLISAMADMGLPCFLSMDALKNRRSPSSMLLEELKVRLCSVDNFRAILKHSGLLETLALISVPEELTIIKQPCGEIICAEHGDREEHCLHLPWGNQLELECEAAGVPPPRYQWFRENVPLRGQNRPLLRIPRFKSENEGDYYCIVSHTVRGIERSITSHYVICKLMHSLVEFIKEGPDQVRVEAESVLSLSVEVKCNTYYSLQWYRDSTLLDGKTAKDLIIEKVSFDDSGKYRCLATNNAGEVWSPITEVEIEKTTSPTTKLALLIGNSNYEKFDSLSTPCNDIILLAEKFKKSDFQVISLVNLTSKEMKKVIDFFFEMATRDSYVVICFIGHGFKYCARNYMMPVDCGDFDEGLEILDSAICDELLVQKAHTKEVGLLLLIVDMCLEEVLADSTTAKLQKNQYLYQPYHKCHVIRLYSTGPHQRAYEVSGQANGCYIKYLSGYLFEDEPLIRLAVKVNEKFWQSGLANYQSPHFTILGGQAMKLRSPSLESGFEVNSLHTTTLYPLNFPKIGLMGVLFEVNFHGEHICNAIDIKFPPMPSHCSFSCRVSQDSIYCTGDSALGVTIYNLQKAEDHISVHVNLKVMNCDGACIEDSSIIPLPYPFIAKFLNNVSSKAQKSS